MYRKVNRLSWLLWMHHRNTEIQRRGILTCGILQSIYLLSLLWDCPLKSEVEWLCLYVTTGSVLNCKHSRGKWEEHIWNTFHFIIMEICLYCTLLSVFWVVFASWIWTRLRHVTVPYNTHLLFKQTWSIYSLYAVCILF